MSKNIVSVTVLILSLTFIFTACVENKAEISQDKLIEEFIKTFYQIDNNEELKEGNLTGNYDYLENKYLKYFTNKEFGRLVANRVFSYNQDCLNRNGISSKLVDLKYEKSNLIYEYSASVEFIDNKGKKIIKSTEGYIRLNDLCVIEYTVLGAIEDSNK